MSLLRRVKKVARPVRAALRRMNPTPTVSVIVPFYNVEAYLEQSVTSILAQALSTIQVILVDDGSTDSSPRIAASLAARDSRVRVLTQENAGPGAARNAGVAKASGRYLAFVDSDDRLPPDALGVLMRSASTNRADIVVGALSRFDSTQAWIPEWVKGPHSTPRQGIRLIERPELLRNNYPVSKVYRRKFWDAQGLSFREGVIYEDQPLIAQMFSRADTINVLTDVTYDYRRRDDRSSISQRPEDIGDLRDRVAAWEISLDALRGEASAEVISGWYDTIYGTHFHWYLNSGSISNPEYWQVLVSSLRTLRAREPSTALRDLSPEKRVALLLLDADRQQEMIAFRDAGGYEPGRFPSSVTPAGLRYDLPVPAGALAGLHPDVLIAPASSLSLRQRLLGGGWLGEGTGLTLRLSGFALIPAVDLGSQPTRVEVFATNELTGEVVHASVQRSDDPALQPSPGDDFASYEGSAYRADFRMAALRGPATVPAQWSLSVRVSSGPFTVTEPLRHLSSQGGLTEAGCRMVDDELQARLVGRGNYHLAVRIVLERPAAVIEHVALLGRDLKVVFRATGKRRFFRLHLRAEGLPIHQTARVRRVSHDRFEAAVRVAPLGESAPSAVSWTIRAEERSGREDPLSWENGRMEDPPIGTGALRAYGSAWGDLALEEYPLGCLVVTDIATAKPGTLTLTGHALLEPGFRLDTIRAGTVMTSAGVQEPGTRDGFRAELTEDDSALWDDADAVTVSASVRDGTDRIRLIPVVLGRGALITLPLVIEGSEIIAERAHGRTLVIRPHGVARAREGK